MSVQVFFTIISGRTEAVSSVRFLATILQTKGKYTPDGRVTPRILQCITGFIVHSGSQQSVRIARSLPTQTGKYTGLTRAEIIKEKEKIGCGYAFRVIKTMI